MVAGLVGLGRRDRAHHDVAVGGTVQTRKQFDEVVELLDQLLVGHLHGPRKGRDEEEGRVEVLGLGDFAAPASWLHRGCQGRCDQRVVLVRHHDQADVRVCANRANRIPQLLDVGGELTGLVRSFELQKEGREVGEGARRRRDARSHLNMEIGRDGRQGRLKA